MSLDISTIIASRICHDNISPIGAIHNGLELISMTASLDVKSPEMGLIHDSCHDARARIEFFRVAFGTYQSGQLMDTSKVKMMAEEIYAAPRFSVTWNISAEIDRTWAQIVYLTLMCLERQLTLGGAINTAISQEQISLIASAERATIAHPEWKRLSSDALPAPTPADVQFHLLPHIARAYGFSLDFAHRETRTTIVLNSG